MLPLLSLTSQPSIARLPLRNMWVNLTEPSLWRPHKQTVDRPVTIASANHAPAPSPGSYSRWMTDVVQNSAGVCTPASAGGNQNICPRLMASALRPLLDAGIRRCKEQQIPFL